MASSVWPVFVDTVEDIAIAVAPPFLYGFFGMLCLWLSALFARGISASLNVFTVYWAVILSVWVAIGVLWGFVVLLFSIVFNCTFITVNGAASTARTGLEHHVLDKKHRHHHYRRNAKGGKSKSRSDDSDDEGNARMRYRNPQQKARR